MSIEEDCPPQPDDNNDRDAPGMPLESVELCTIVCWFCLIIVLFVVLFFHCCYNSLLCILRQSQPFIY